MRGLMERAGEDHRTKRCTGKAVIIYNNKKFLDYFGLQHLRELPGTIIT